ncbi:hypothetical protein RB195_014771 [Necator americanus]|uniref:Uncharacterized protein n=1 Tax=Necator americanus TaxID=51031 RepID=A0ABR1E1I6_NECAM
MICTINIKILLVFVLINDVAPQFGSLMIPPYGMYPYAGMGMPLINPLGMPMLGAGGIDPITGAISGALMGAAAGLAGLIDGSVAFLSLAPYTHSLENVGRRVVSTSLEKSSNQEIGTLRSVPAVADGFLCDAFVRCGLHSAAREVEGSSLAPTDSGENHVRSVCCRDMSTSVTATNGKKSRKDR